MNDTELMDIAQEMFLKDKRRKEVIDFFKANGKSETDAEQCATNAFLAVKDQRQETIDDLQADAKKAGRRNVIFGAVLFFGGLIATLTTDRTWYGVMFLGIVALFKGLSKRY